MPVIPAHRSTLNILKNFRTEIANRTGITNFDRKSKVRAINDTLSVELINQMEEQITAIYAGQLSNASGLALDEIGDKLNLPRIRSTHCNVNSTERNLGFYVESGTFGAINGGAPLTIPIGTIVSSTPNNNELGTSIEYQLIQDVTLGISETIKFVTARAVNIGSASNVGKSILRQHNFTNYVDSANDTLKCINFYPILNGVDDELDDLYRYRLANHYSRLLQNNEVRMKLTALNVPGIVNTRVEPGYFGIGTAAVFALGPENQANTRLLDSLQQRLDSWRIPAGDYLATAATEVKFDFDVELQPSKSLTTNQIVRLKSEVNKAFLQYFRTLTLGSVVDMTVLSNTIQRNIKTVASFSRRGNVEDQFFKRVFIRKGYSNGATDEKEKLITSVYSLERDEYASLGILNLSII